MKKIYLICFLCLLLCGCTTKDYSIEKTDMMTPEAVNEEYIINSDWWKLYKDPALDSLVETALKRNPDLALAAIAVDKAQHTAEKAGMALLPDMVASGSASVSKAFDKGVTSHKYVLSFGLSYELDLWSKIRDTASASEWTYKATVQDKETARLSLINSVVNTWFNLMYLRQSLEISRKNLDAYKKLHAVMTEKYKQGKVFALNAAQTEQNVLTQNNTISDFEKKINAAEEAMKLLLNIRPNEKFDIPQSNILTVSVPSPNLNVPLAMLSARPDVLSAEFKVKSAFKTWSATKKSLYPTVTVGAGLDPSAITISSLLESSVGSGFVKLSLPIFDWKNIHWNIKISEDDFNTALITFNKKLNTALNEVNLYRMNRETALSLFENNVKKHDADIRIERDRKIRYESGVDELSDWLTALRTKNSSELDILSSKYTVISDTNALFQAMGGEVVRK